AQHFTREHLDRLTEIRHARVAWGIPLYSANSQTHDAIVGRKGAFDKLVESLGLLLLAGARIELRTVMMQQNVSRLAELSQFVVRNLAHIEQWSIMGLENIGFARNRWDDLYCDTRKAFPHLAEAINIAVLHGLAPRVFNIPLCHLPENYRKFAVASISDWKQRFGKACGVCSVRTNCSGFFEWHPDYLVEEVEPL
ncbi:MAG: His-Xaa-Ser system radical SAM maturase HxsC, partial [Verrucomicrobiae bacterium]|nr:His-Xaa-Ser system radical SAM maturase HxsC [Verrucomicrobiae bacterium]